MCKIIKYSKNTDLGLGVEHAHLHLIMVMAIGLAEVNQTGLDP